MNAKNNITIRSVGKYVPKHILTNDDLTQWLDTSDEWISSRTGIHQRHISLGENTSDLCIQAARQILSRAEVNGEEIGLIVTATMSPDSHSPSVACKIQAAIGADQAMAFDINAACSGFVYACSIAEKILLNSPYQYALVMGGEVMSKVLDWSDRSTAVLFGDGAGGVLLQRNAEIHSFLGEDIHADGTREHALISDERPVQNLLVKKKRETGFLKMDGREIFDFVVRTIPKSIRHVVETNDLELEDVDYFLLHQANARLIQAVAKKLKLPLEKFPVNISKYGNTSAASLPILLDELVEEGTITFGSNQTIVLTGFGGGLTWGSLLIRV